MPRTLDPRALTNKWLAAIDVIEGRTPTSPLRTVEQAQHTKTVVEKQLPDVAYRCRCCGQKTTELGNLGPRCSTKGVGRIRRTEPAR